MSPRKSAAIARIREDRLHRTVADLLDWALTDRSVYTTFPAGWGKLPKATAGRLRGAGLKAGMPDILIFHDSCCYGIELKVEGRKPSAAQQLMFPRLRRAGMRIFVCQSVDDVFAALHDAQIPIRARLGWVPSRGVFYGDETGDSDAEARRAAELT